QAVHQELRGHTMDVLGLSFSPDGTRLATSGVDGSVILWDWSAGKPALPPFRCHFAGVSYVSFSSDGRTLVSHTGERNLRFWNVATGTEVLLLPDAESVYGCPISPDGRTLAWRQVSSGVVRL